MLFLYLKNYPYPWKNKKKAKNNNNNEIVIKQIIMTIWKIDIFKDYNSKDLQINSTFKLTIIINFFRMIITSPILRKGCIKH